MAGGKRALTSVLPKGDAAPMNVDSNGRAACMSRLLYVRCAHHADISMITACSLGRRSSLADPAREKVLQAYQRCDPLDVGSCSGLSELARHAAPHRSAGHALNLGQEPRPWPRDHRSRHDALGDGALPEVAVPVAQG